MAATVPIRPDAITTGGCEPAPDLPDLLEGEALDIEAEFRRKLAGLRGLSRQQRGGVARAAFEWKQSALQALRDKRAKARRGRWAFRQNQRPAPT